MLSIFLFTIVVNQTFMFAMDVFLNKRIHRAYLEHFAGTSLALVPALAFVLNFPAFDFAFIQERGGNLAIKVFAGLLLFDVFVYVVHKYLEHGILWRWHKHHHAFVTDRELTYYSPSVCGLPETIYYLGVQVAICMVLGFRPMEMFVFITWVFQQGAYMHQRGLPQLPWPLISPRHHRNHHFHTKTYLSGLFLFLDETAVIDPRAVEGYSRPG